MLLDGVFRHGTSDNTECWIIRTLLYEGRQEVFLVGRDIKHQCSVQVTKKKKRTNIVESKDRRTPENADVLTKRNISHVDS